jgi:uncharacterized protein YcfJ
MNRTYLARLSISLLTAAVLAFPVTTRAQETHEDAVAQTHRHDRRHHTKAKFVGTGAVGGALIGAKAGGPVGAVVGAGAGAVAGIGANKLHRRHEIRHREKYGTPHQ